MNCHFGLAKLSKYLYKTHSKNSGFFKGCFFGKEVALDFLKLLCLGAFWYSTLEVNI